VPKIDATMPKLKNLFMKTHFGAFSTFLLSKLHLFPSLEVAGCDFRLRDVTLKKLEPLLVKAPHLRLLTHCKDTLWSIAVLEKHAFVTNFYALKELRDRYPSQMSFDINATNPDTGLTPMYYSLDLLGRSDILDNLIDLGADPNKRVIRRKDGRFAHGGRLISPFLTAILQNHTNLVDLLWKKHAEKYSSRPAREWIDEEPLHPLVAAFTMDESQTLLKLLQTWKWDYFLPADDPLVSKDYVRLPHSAPLILSCFHTATAQCARVFMEYMKGDIEFMEQLLATLHSPSPLPQGGCWLFWMAAQNEIFDELMNIPGVDKTAVDRDGIGLFAHYYFHARTLSPDLGFNFRMYTEAIQSSSNSPVVKYLQDLILSEPPDGEVPSFVRHLQRALLSCEHGMSLFGFLTEHHHRIHSKYLSLFLRVLPDTAIVRLDKLPMSISPSELNTLASIVASSPTTYERSIAWTLRALKSAGAQWLDSQEFVDLVWSTWPRKLVAKSGVLSIPSRIPLPTSGTVKMQDLVELFQSWDRLPAAAWQLMQRNEAGAISDDTWSISFESMFPPGFTSARFSSWGRFVSGHKELYPAERLVFTKFITSLEFKDPNVLVAHIIDGMISEISPLALKQALSSNHLGDAKTEASVKLWQTLFSLSSQDLYASQMGDVLVDLKMKTPEGSKPALYQMRCASISHFTDSSTSIESQEYTRSSVLIAIFVFFRSPCDILQLLLKMPWDLTKNAKSDPLALLWREIMRAKDSTGHFKFRSPTFLLPLLESIGQCKDSSLPLLSTLTACGIFDCLESLPSSILESAVVVEILAQRPKLVQLMLEHRLSPIENKDRFESHPPNVFILEATSNAFDETDSGFAQLSPLPASVFTTLANKTPSFGETALAPTSSNPFGPQSSSSFGGPSLASSPAFAAPPSSSSFSHSPFGVNTVGVVSPLTENGSANVFSSPFGASASIPGQVSPGSPFTVSKNPFGSISSAQASAVAPEAENPFGGVQPLPLDFGAASSSSSPPSATSTHAKNHKSYRPKGKK
jgi:hypothetical protein